jgi:hypothetical protein
MSAAAGVLSTSQELPPLGEADLPPLVEERGGQKGRKGE